jgi:hypothetical protein
MKTPKETAKSLVDHMADDISWTELVHRLVLLAKIAQAEVDVEEGNMKMHDEFMKELDQWLESPGPSERKKKPKTTTRELQKTR